jgi:hypothetical protein
LIGPASPEGFSAASIRRPSTSFDSGRLSRSCSPSTTSGWPLLPMAEHVIDRAKKRQPCPQAGHSNNDPLGSFRRTTRVSSPSVAIVNEFVLLPPVTSAVKAPASQNGRTTKKGKMPRSPRWSRSRRFDDRDRPDAMPWAV